MQFIFDHIYATIIAGTVMFMLALLNLNILEISWTETSVNAGKELSIGMARWIEADLGSIGSRADSDQAPIVVWPTQSTEGNTLNITLYRDSLLTGGFPLDTLRTEIRYTLTLVDTIAVADSTLEAYQLVRQTRSQTGAAGAWSSWAEDGRSSPRLQAFSIVPLTVTGTTATSVAQTRYLRIQFALIPPFIQSNSYLNLMNWQTTVVV